MWRTPVSNGGGDVISGRRSREGRGEEMIGKGIVFQNVHHFLPAKLVF